jgi:DNA-directed RNA polymerase subunit beta
MTATRRLFQKPYIRVSLPDLVEIQTRSYEQFFREGLRELLDELNPIDDFTGRTLSLEFGQYELEKPKYDEMTAKAKNLTFKAPLKCEVVLTNKMTGKKKKAAVFLGEFPIMTPRGTFIINGVERVIVNQIVRSFGVLFVVEEVANRKLFGAKIIPSRGSWLEFETSPKNVISVKVDRKRRIPATQLLRALGMSDDQIDKAFADTDTDADHKYIEATRERDTTNTQEEALVEVYKRIRPGDLVTPESAKLFIENMLWNPKRYDLGKVGRYKLNQRLGLTVANTIENRILRLEDLVAVIKEIIRLNNDQLAQPDDIDHLKNRRIRSVGELVANRLRVGLLRMERIVKDRMAVSDPNEVMPAQLVNSRPIVAVLQEFFASSQLSQFMNQTNPLAELEHKRTLSATGPGGLSRERAGFEVRDVHRSHYGRICPIETPEGPNIGLVGYLASYGRINEYGFLETPYLKVKKDHGSARITDEVAFMDAHEEEQRIIAPASSPLDDKGRFLDTRLVVRKEGEPVVGRVDDVDYMDVSPQQTLSIATALIPFLEHDNAVRAAMGANMMRQAVPLAKPESPIVGTGMEAAAARDSGQVIVAEEDGTVVQVSSDSMTIKGKSGKPTTYVLQKFVRSNQATCINQRPIVSVGSKVKRGQVIADSSATDQGELALGRNLIVAFMSFRGGNYEDAIVISDRLVKEDTLTSVHIEKYTMEVRETKLGPEVVTRDIPNVSEEALANLDEQGIVRIGAEVSAGDILVGKISPKGETELSAEEKLLRAIFGEKAKDVKDTSLRLPHGERGKVVGVKLFSKDQGDELATGVYQMVEVSVAQLRKISVGDKLAGRHGNKGVISRILPAEEMPFLADGTPVDVVLNPLGVVSRMNLGQVLETHLGWAASRLGYKVESPPFESVTWEDALKEMEKAGIPVSGKVTLFDGQTGDAFDQAVTVGVMYIMKLIHLVDDKMHARSTGPYSMITQQPLGGKAQFGGQRFGEMEVWALEAYGAAYSLQEMLTIKSDDVIGRGRAYEAIIKGEEIMAPSIPASFLVLVRELQSLGLNVEMLKLEGKSAKPIEEEKPKVRVTPAAPQEGEEEPGEPDIEAAVTELKAEEPVLVSEEVKEE